jgi:hypothetical protein
MLMSSMLRKTNALSMRLALVRSITDDTITGRLDVFSAPVTTLPEYPSNPMYPSY